MYERETKLENMIDKGERKRRKPAT
jgi:hypothetical protein